MVVKENKIRINELMGLYHGLGSKLYVLLRNIVLPVEKIEEYLPSKGRIIDVGCGFGSYDIYFALRSPKRDIIGYELNERRVKEARNASKGIKNIKFEVKNLEEDSSLKDCDAICFFDILHHIPWDSQKKVLNESYKRLKRGGILIIKDIDKKPKWKYYFNFLHDKIMTRNDRLYFSYKEDVLSLVKALNFKVLKGPEYLKVGFLNPYSHYILIVKK